MHGRSPGGWRYIFPFSLRGFEKENTLAAHVLADYIIISALGEPARDNQIKGHVRDFDPAVFIQGIIISCIAVGH